MVEQQVEIVVFVVDGDPFLACDKRKVGAEFQDERFQFPQDGILHVSFGVMTTQAEKIQEVRIAEHHVGCQPVFVAQGRDVLLDQLVGFFADRRPFVKQMADLVLESASAPSFDATHFCVKVAFELVIDRQKLAKMGPRQL